MIRKGEGYISQVEVDQFRFARQSIEAQLEVAKAGVAQAEASLENSEANLNYTRIISPVDGIVIERKIEPGQTLAAQFQTPELFVVAPDIRREMHIFASVDEADIGLIRAGPGVRPAGPVQCRRVSRGPLSRHDQADSPQPGGDPKRGDLSGGGFDTESRSEADARHDRQPVFSNRSTRRMCRGSPMPLCDSFPKSNMFASKIVIWSPGVTEHDEDDLVENESAEEKATAAMKRSQRYVWVWEEPWLRAVPVTIGIRDSKWSELVEGTINVGDELVVAKKQKQ